MPRFFFGLMLCTLAGCGISVEKPDPTKKAEKPAAVSDPVEPAPSPASEVYDKVAPMPREAHKNAK